MIAAQHLVTSALRTLLRHQPISTGKVTLAWKVAVGDTMSRVTSVSLSAEGVLAVRATDQHWAKEIHRSNRLIMSRLNQLLGDSAVKTIDVTFHTPR